ncbi:glycosyltransferase family 2 protein [Candidatus Uhrbacteria bacterium]|nr:glycosyltransferase family 2 protein [Candidatus Uhrbacteria bacterium]
MISVIIPVHNSAKNLPMTLQAIFSQVYQDFEVIVVNDGSTDHIEKSLAPYRSRITYLSQERKGRCAARNTGFVVSRGEYVIFLDAAAVMSPSMLATLLDALHKNFDCSFAYSAFKWGWKTFSSFPYDPDSLRQMNYIHTSALIRREHFAGFDEKIEKFNDWDLWLTMMEHGHTGIYVPQVLFTVKPHGATVSAWLPSCMYKIPWKKFGIPIPAIEKYKKWKKIVMKKHGLL